MVNSDDLTDAVRHAVVVLEERYGPPDDVVVEAGVADRLQQFRQAVLDNRVAEGYLFDANHERDLVEFDLLFGQLVSDILSGSPDNAIFRRGPHMYLVAPLTPDAAPGTTVRVLTRSGRTVLGADSQAGVALPANVSPAGLAEKLELVENRGWVFDAKQTLQQHQADQRRPVREL